MLKCKFLTSITNGSISSSSLFILISFSGIFSSKSNKSNNSNKSKKSNKSESSINKRKSSKYKGVFYEEGLFMWSAEVDGKHLGLFPSEEEAHEKREEYIKSRS